MTPDLPAMSAARVVPVLATEIEGEGERDDSLAYGGGDVEPVNAIVELQRRPEHQGWETECEKNESGIDPGVDAHPLGARVCGYSDDPNGADHEPDAPETKHRAEGYMRPACGHRDAAKHDARECASAVVHVQANSPGPVFRNDP